MKIALGACAVCGNVRDARTIELQPQCPVCAARKMIPSMHESILTFRSGSNRTGSEEAARGRSHTYVETKDDELLPMCGYGWNRSDGTRFSIFRGSVGTLGDCKRCAANLYGGKPPVIGGWKHKTKLL